MVTSGRRRLRPCPVLDPIALRVAFRDAGIKEMHMHTVWKYVISSAEPDLIAPEDSAAVWRKLHAAHSTLPLAAVEVLSQNFTPCSSRVEKWQSEHERGNGKLILELQDGQCIETVIIEHAGPRPRSTVCVSSQVGCKMGCAFCATGTMGLRSQLTAGEIAEQLLHAQQRVRPEAPVRNVVFMGMGEPLDNYQQVLGALEVMGDSKGFGLSLKNITVSTVGVPGKIAQLGVDCPGVHLALSLHAPTQELRTRIVPSAKGNSLDRIMDEIDGYSARTGNKVMLEYILISGTNASNEDAHALGALLSGRQALITLNLIPYNPTSVGAESGFSSPCDAECKQFRNIVASYRRAVDAPGCTGIADAKAGAPILCTIRWSTVPGQSNEAACGQLALESSAQPKPARQKVKDIEDCVGAANRVHVKRTDVPFGFPPLLPIMCVGNMQRWSTLLITCALAAAASFGSVVCWNLKCRVQSRLR